jgi:hypothetical protein
LWSAKGDGGLGHFFAWIEHAVLSEHFCERFARIKAGVTLLGQGGDNMAQNDSILAAFVDLSFEPSHSSFEPIYFSIGFNQVVKQIRFVAHLVLSVGVS